MTVDWSFVHKIWEKWAANNVGSLGPPLKAALLLNYDPTGPSRLVSIIAEQEGIKADPIELSQLLGFVKKNKLQTEFFFVGTNQYLVTSIHENWFCARCLNSSNQAGEGAIVMQTSAFLVVGLEKVFSQIKKAMDTRFGLGFYMARAGARIGPDLIVFTPNI